ncbi:hypothetical protein [Thermococcus waiotapuensis]|uniref:Uncharacterized protein n=1 Tax=Thermococcus waiotapuensis TaxID=90909 RepID=A0AAE4NUY0_9EURY|nr:hypothetical protein [Thermococcus waiotapuensis]MDV3103293.1 hypothetical protein [Thermococcus waiotapuensis]
MLREIRRELVEYIHETTGIDRETIIKALQAEESFFVMQVEKSLKNERSGREES